MNNADVLKLAERFNHQSDERMKTAAWYRTERKDEQTASAMMAASRAYGRCARELFAAIRGEPIPDVGYPFPIAERIALPKVKPCIPPP